MVPISPTRSLGSRSKEQWSEISSVEPFRFSESNSSFQPMTISPDVDAMRISARQAGSGSRSQWTTFEKQEAFARSASQAAKELDLALALGDLPAVPSSSDVDDMSTYMQSEATYDHSEATAVTGNVSTASIKAPVTPENSPTEGRSRSESRDRGGRQRRGHESPEPRRLVMCGAVDVNNELKGSIQDVNDTVRQIFTTVRRFGPAEKDAIRETFKDAHYFMKEKVRSALSRKSDCSRTPDREPMDESPPRRRNRETNKRQNAVREVQHQNGVVVKAKVRADERAEVVHEKSEPKGIRMLV